MFHLVNLKMNSSFVRSREIYSFQWVCPRFIPFHCWGRTIQEFLSDYFKHSTQYCLRGEMPPQMNLCRGACIVGISHVVCESRNGKQKNINQDIFRTFLRSVHTIMKICGKDWIKSTNHLQCLYTFGQHSSGSSQRISFPKNKMLMC